jgi:hypothetical protein
VAMPVLSAGKIGVTNISYMSSIPVIYWFIFTEWFHWFVKSVDSFGRRILQWAGDRCAHPLREWTVWIPSNKVSLWFRSKNSGRTFPSRTDDPLSHKLCDNGSSRSWIFPRFSLFTSFSSRSDQYNTQHCVAIEIKKEKGAQYHSQLVFRMSLDTFWLGLDLKVALLVRWKEVGAGQAPLGLYFSMLTQISHSHIIVYSCVAHLMHACMQHVTNQKEDTKAPQKMKTRWNPTGRKTNTIEFKLLTHLFTLSLQKLHITIAILVGFCHLRSKLASSWLSSSVL